MCGIFAYLNYHSPQTMQVILQTLLTGLRRLEYRGYDSAGLAVTEPKTNQILVLREVGNVDKLAALVQHTVTELQLQTATFTNHVGIAHTRWATHGEVAVRNSHPQSSTPEHEFVVIHNGIITNYAQIRSSLEKEGYSFQSETDTEVVAKLALYFYRHQKSKLQHEPEFRAVISKVLETIQGAYALVIKSAYYPDQIVAAKRGSPLIMGVKLPAQSDSARTTTQLVNVIFGDDKSRASASLQNELVAHQLEQEQSAVEYYLASDINAIVEHTRKVIYLEDDDMVYIDQRGKFHFYRSEDRATRSSQEVRELTTLELGLSQFSKGNFAHYMLKEIFEQEESVINTCRGRLRHDHNSIQLGGLSSHIDSIKRCRRIIFCACGTSYNSATATQQLVEELTDLPVSVELASDFLDRRTPIFRDDTVFFISQSGETADTIAALEYCKKRGALCVGITNTVGSSIARLTDCGVHLNAGPEIGVASTKAYTSQIIAIILIALVLGQDRMSLSARREQVIQELKRLPQLIHEALQLEEQIKKLAVELSNVKSLFLIGRGFQRATCLEAALKIKEIAYIHSEAILAGELKHGPLALIDEHATVIFFLAQDSVYNKAQNALHQITARKGRPVVVCSEVDEHLAKTGLPIIKVPHTVDCLQTIVNIVPMQLLAYHLAVLKGFNVDQPRNLAKSVTVE